MARPFQGDDQPRHPRFEARLGRLPSRPGARGSAERPRRPLRRHGLRRLVALRRADRDADPAAPGRRRAHLRAVAHDRAVLAHALRVPHGPQPPPERLRLDLRDLDRLPGLQLAHPARERLDGDRAARRRLEHVLGRQEPQHPRRRVDDGLVEEGLAARARLRPLLRLHRRRDEPVVSRPRRGQPLHRASRTAPRTATTSRRTWPTRRSSSSATPSSPSPASRGTCGSARAPTTRRTTRRRSSSTSTRASSTTATRPTASGSCRA